MFESFGGVGTKDKPLVRTESSSSVKVWLEKCFLNHVFWYWKVYVLMIAAVDFPDEDLHWFCGKRTLIDGVYMRLHGGVGSKIASLPM